MLYNKKIRYLNYCEEGERVRGAGYLKLEEREGTLRMELAVSGLRPTDSFVRDIVFCTEDREEIIDKITISGGQGQYRQLWRKADNLGGSGVGSGQLRGVRIPLGGSREISCTWQPESSGKEMSRERPAAVTGKEMSRERPAAVTGKETSREKPAAVTGKETSRERPAAVTGKERLREMIAAGSGKIGAGHSAETQNRREEKADRKAEAVPDKQIQPERFLEADYHEASQDRAGEPEERRAKSISAEEGQAGLRKAEKSGQTELLEDKWSQLWAIYPHINPFRDGREYLSVGPADFVLFSSASYKQANNSFLLHGYYNYHHLILTKVEQRGESLYYIGVPGAFYEREKQVAVMFGFESFECAEEPAQTGDFGYYMMRVRL